MSDTIDVNARFYIKGGHGSHCVHDRLLGDKHVFCNGSKQDCREWVKRNHVEPDQNAKAVGLRLTAPKLLALLKRYQEIMPSPEAARLILEAEGYAE